MYVYLYSSYHWFQICLWGKGKSFKHIILKLTGPDALRLQALRSGCGAALILQCVSSQEIKHCTTHPWTTTLTQQVHTHSHTHLFIPEWSLFVCKRAVLISCFENGKTQNNFLGRLTLLYLFVFSSPVLSNSIKCQRAWSFSLAQLKSQWCICFVWERMN